MTEHAGHTQHPDLDLAALRARYAAALPDVAVDPAPIVRRGRRRRTLTRAGAGVGALALVVAVAVGGSALRPEPDRTTGTPPPDAAGRVELWVSAEQVPPGSQVAVVAMATDPTVEASFGMDADLERWEDGAWVPVRAVDLCAAPLDCSASDPDLDSRPGYLVTITKHGGVGRLDAPPDLEPGAYRLTQVSAEGLSAHGRFEVAEDAPQPAPLDADDAEPLYLSQTVLRFGTTYLGASAATWFGSGYSSLTMPDTLTVRAWDPDEGWQEGEAVPTSAVPTMDSGFPSPSWETQAELPGLAAGAYRLEAETAHGTLAATFWVVGSGPLIERATILGSYDGAPLDIPQPDVGWNEAPEPADPPLGAAVRLATRTVDVWQSGSCGGRISAVGVQDGMIVVYLQAGPFWMREWCDGRAPTGPTATAVIAFPDGFEPAEAPHVEIRSVETGEALGTDVPGLAAHACDADGGFTCAARRWLDDIVDGSGYPEGGVSMPGRAGRQAVESALSPDETAFDVSFQVVAAGDLPGLGVVREEWRSEIGNLTLRYGRSEDLTVTAAIDCGGYEIRFQAWGESRFHVKPVSEAIAAQLDFCPADLDELLDRYKDW